MSEIVIHLHNETNKKMKTQLRTSKDFKKGDTVFHLQPYNFNISADRTAIYSENPKNNGVLTFEINKYTVHSSGKKVIKFINSENSMVKWADYFDFNRNNGNVYYFYFATYEEAEKFMGSILVDRTKKIVQ